MMLPGSMIWNSSIHQYPKEGPQPRTRAGNQPLARKVPPQVTERTLRANRPAATPAMPGRSRGKRATLKISDFYGHFCLRDLAILCRLSRSTNIINRIIECPSSRNEFLQARSSPVLQGGGAGLPTLPIGAWSAFRGGGRRAREQKSPRTPKISN
jgi:hypothetical protein